ncbi:unnamed protein product [marine sediment metagenome]|uniref:Uncharacterized protein n=1 Tax=marine sediment metagenome TaxID=412755 RepID=X0U457_9ZZZZ
MQNQLNKFKIDTPITLYLDNKEPKRSSKQNSYYWVYLTEIECETGNSKEDLHSLFKGKFLSNGFAECFGEKVRKVKSTTKLTKGEFVEFIYNIEVFTGITAPDTKNYGL